MVVGRGRKKKQRSPLQIHFPSMIETAFTNLDSTSWSLDLRELVSDCRRSSSAISLFFSSTQASETSLAFSASSTSCPLSSAHPAHPAVTQHSDDDCQSSQNVTSASQAVPAVPANGVRNSRESSAIRTDGVPGIAMAHEKSNSDALLKLFLRVRGTSAPSALPIAVSPVAGSSPSSSLHDSTTLAGMLTTSFARTSVTASDADEHGRSRIMSFLNETSPPCR